MEHLDLMRDHIGPLKLPREFPSDFGPEWQAELPTEPSAGVEALIIECLRGNAALCADAVPPELFQDFALLLEERGGDPSTSSLLDFFTIACRPEGPDGPIDSRNQALAIDVITSDKLEKLKGSINAINDCEQPARICDLLSATIQGNPKCAHSLSAKTEVGIDSILLTLAQSVTRVKTNPGTKDLGEALLQDELCKALIELLSHLMCNLVSSW